MIELKPTQNDDAQFVALASQLLNTLISLNSPKDIYVIQIDHWFDHKWHHFSGKTIGAFGTWMSTVTLPPFDPGRVVSQNYYRLEDESIGKYRHKSAKLLHLDQWSGNNFHRFMKAVSSSGIFFWFSGETAKLDRASMMVYVVEGNRVFPWYASFIKRDGWIVNKLKNISRMQFKVIIAQMSTNGGIQQAPGLDSP